MADCIYRKKKDPFNDWGGRVCNKCVPVLGGNGTKIVSTGDIFHQPSGQVQRIRGKLVDHVGNHVVLSPEGAVLVTSSGTRSSYPRPPLSLNSSKMCNDAFRRMFLDGTDADKMIAQTNAYLAARYGYWVFRCAQLLIAGGAVLGPVPFDLLAHWLLIVDRMWLIFRGVQRLGRAGIRRFRPRGGHQNSPFRG